MAHGIRGNTVRSKGGIAGSGHCNDALLLSDSLVPDQASVAKLLTDGGKMMADLRIKKHDHYKK